MISCIILLGGRGERFGYSKAKQYFKIGGKSLLLHCLEAVASVQYISQIVVVCESLEISKVRSIIDQNIHLKRIISINYCNSGPLRSDSVLNGLQACTADTKWVLIHDGARAFCPSSLIEKLCITMLEQKTAIVPTMPCIDTIVEVSTKQPNRIEKTLKRANLRQVQTPQCFPYTEILNAYETGKRTNFEGTDCSSYALQAGQIVHFIQGSEENFKMTYPEDVIRATELLSKRGIAK